MARPTRQESPHVQFSTEELRAKMRPDGSEVAIFNEMGELVFQANKGMQELLFVHSNPDGAPNADGVLCDSWICDEILMGSGRGPGKTYGAIAWLAWPTLIANPKYRALLVRRNQEDLKETLDKAEPMYRLHGAKKAKQVPQFVFPSGAIIYTGHLKDSKALEKYRGGEYHRIVIEEAQHIESESDYLKLLGSNRSSLTGIRAQVLLTANPDGPGNAWLQSRFVKVQSKEVGADYIPPRTPFLGSNKRVRLYLPGLLAENLPLMENDPNYINVISDPDLPEHTRRAWVFGDWDCSAGAFFPMFRSRRLSGEPDEALHVVPSDLFKQPSWCHRWMSLDWGITHHTAVYWFAFGRDKRIHVENEYVVAGVGTHEIGTDIAKESLPLLEQMKEPRLRIFADSGIFGSAGDKGNSLAEQIAAGIDSILGPGSTILLGMNTREREVAKDNPARALEMQNERITFQESMDSRRMSIYLTPANKDRKAGWELIRGLLRWRRYGERAEPDLKWANWLLEKRGATALSEYLEKFEKQKTEVLPKMLIHDCCRVLIDTIPKLIADHKKPGDTLKWDSRDKEIGDDPADAWRYGCMAYRDFIAKMPQEIYVEDEVERLLANYPHADFNDRILVARTASQRYGKVFGADDTPIILHRDALSLRQR